MAEDWIKMRTNLFDDPRVVRISAILCPKEQRERAFRVRILGCLFLTWALADEHTTDGFLRNYSAKNLDDYTETPGWSAALAEVGWLEIRMQGLVITKFREHNGESAKKRVQKNKRQSKWRNCVDAPVDAPASTSAPPSRLPEQEQEQEQDKIRAAAAAAADLLAAASENLLEELRKRGLDPGSVRSELEPLAADCLLRVLDEFDRRLANAHSSPVDNPPGLLRKMLREHHQCGGKHAEILDLPAKRLQEKLARQAAQREQLFGEDLAAQLARQLRGEDGS